MKHTGFSATCGAALLLALAAPAVAQDEGRGIGYAATGPIFTLPAGVSVEREEVHISIHSVRLAYVFGSSTHRTVHFSFAMPEMPVDAGPDIAVLDEYSEAAGLAADTQPANYLRLSVGVNGRRLALAGRGRALLEGRDVTRRLLDAGVPLLSGPEGDPIWRQLPPEKRAELEAGGLMSSDSALWTYQADFEWDAALAPGETRVEVSYAPLSDYWSDITLDAFPEIAPGGSATRAYCIDDAVRRAFLSGARRYELYTVTHLASPDGWRGPTRHYRLVVDKQHPTDLVAFCPLEAGKISPTRFEWTATDHTSGDETGVLFFWDTGATLDGRMAAAFKATLAAPPLVPLDVATVPAGPLQAAYPDDWRQAGYQALFSPDRTLMALGIEDGAGYVMQVWLYQPASGRLVAASPRTHEGAAEEPGDIAELNSWLWGGDGRFYVRARRPRGEDGVFGADMNGYAELRDLPPDVTGQLAANDAARWDAARNSEVPEGERPPGFDDDSYNEQEGGGFIAWAQNRGHGAFDLLAARAGDAAPRLVASGGWEIADFQFDPGGTRLFHNGEDGLVVTDPGTGVTRRVKGTRGTAVEVRPIALSADGDILVYRAVGSCGRDAADALDADTEDDTARRVCVAYLPPAETMSSQAAPETAPARADVTPADPWVGRWDGTVVSALIRRSAAKPDYLVIDLVTGTDGCSGAVTLYGKPSGTTVIGESHDPADPTAPACRVELSRNGNALDAGEVGPCAHYHGASCGFDGGMTRSE